MSLKICQRCQLEFECLSDDIPNCACNKIQLSPECITQIKEQYTDCLCNTCLEVLAKEYPVNQ